MMDAPSTLDKSQLRELSLEIKNKKSWIFIWNIRNKNGRW
jgi:hypothetical protein